MCFPFRNAHNSVLRTEHEVDPYKSTCFLRLLQNSSNFTYFQNVCPVEKSCSAVLKPTACTHCVLLFFSAGGFPGCSRFAISRRLKKRPGLCRSKSPQLKSALPVLTWPQWELYSAFLRFFRFWSPVAYTVPANPGEEEDFTHRILTFASSLPVLCAPATV